MREPNSSSSGGGKGILTLEGLQKIMAKFRDHLVTAPLKLY